jgi:hypothetical protein
MRASTRELVLVAGIISAPFWLMASNWGDMSEAASTGLGATLAPILLAAYRKLMGGSGELLMTDLRLPDGAKVNQYSYWRGFRDAGGES